MKEKNDAIWVFSLPTFFIKSLLAANLPINEEHQARFDLQKLRIADIRHLARLKNLAVLELWNRAIIP